MNDGRFAIMSDIHGEHRMLDRALTRCRDRGVDHLILLGDLFDRMDQMERCADQLSDWTVTGVLGNHERDALRHGGELESTLNGFIARLVESLSDHLVLGEALFVHDHAEVPCDADADGEHPRIVFSGHTHYRQAKDDNGPLDLSLGKIELRDGRRYLINPGALIDGQFAIWERDESHVLFERV